MRIYTQDDLANYALIQQEKRSIARNMSILSRCGKATTTPGTEAFIRRLNWKYLDVLEDSIKKLGVEVPDDIAKQIELLKKEEKTQ